MNKLPIIKPFINSNLFDDLCISSITDDSRDVQENSLFIARQGVDSHGNEFIGDAIQKGASCIITDRELGEQVDIPILYLENLEEKILKILFSFYDLSEDDFVFHGAIGSMYKQIGNAVAVDLAYEIAKLIKKNLS